ncbi:MAG TPA: sugar phosphate isomerase/epimerase [Gemmatimonadaceae bacterium]|nr:sugar phosphate isomerase/epimerase [Gemmatimonadaceae bacterium]
MKPQTRRSFLATLGVAAVGAATRDAHAATALFLKPRKLEKVGLQLYTVRDLMKADMPGTIAKVAQIGYKEVEFAGYFGRTPDQVRKLLDDNHLTSPSTHLPFEALDNWKKTLADSKRIGHHWVTLPYIPPEKRKTVDDWKKIAARFNRAGDEANESGLRFAYHNHDLEFKPVGGTLPFDILLGETDPKHVDFEMDIYWVYFGGADPLVLFNRYPHRFPLVHVKDSSAPPERKMVDVGSGVINWPAIFAQSQKAGPIRHYFVEHDQPADPIATIRNSYNYLHNVSF